MNNENERLCRTAALLGDAAMEKIKNANVLLFGLGGVGGYCAEALVRSGIGKMTLVDNDDVSVSNLNRQLFATVSTLGMRKTDAAEERLHAVNPDVQITKINAFFMPDTPADLIDFGAYDFVVDAIDTVAGKLEIISRAMQAGVPVISAMGAGNKLDPSQFTVSDIAKTDTCPLARVMRIELRKRGILHLPVVWSREAPHAVVTDTVGGRHAPASFAPAVAAAGMLLAAEVLKRLGSYDA